jgi:AraC family transcriptional regulator
VTGSPVAHAVPGLGPSVAVYPAGATFGPRRSESHEFVWVISGSCRWTGDERKLDLAPGQLLLIRAGTRDTFEWAADRSTRHGYVHFTVEPHAPASGWPLCQPMTGAGSPLDALCDYLIRLGSSGASRHRVDETLTLVLHAFVYGAIPDGSAASVPAAVRAMMRAVDRAWADGVARPLALRELADGAGVSERTLSRVFGNRFGVGPVAGLELLRLARAEPLLRLSNLSLEAIAHACGFADAFHFSHRFQAAYGMPPRQFRADGPGPDGCPADRRGLLRLVPGSAN